MLPEMEDMMKKKLKQLYSKLDACYKDEKAIWATHRPDELIAESRWITAVKDAHYFLKNVYAPDESEVDTLLLLWNPLTDVANAWYAQLGDLSDFVFALKKILEKPIKK